MDVPFPSEIKIVLWVGKQFQKNYKILIKSIIKVFLIYNKKVNYHTLKYIVSYLVNLQKLIKQCYIY